MAEETRGLHSPFHTEIPENTRVMCSGIYSRIVRFGSFTLPVIFRNLCVHSHTTRKDPVKTRDLSCDVYNAPLTISLNWRMISASALIVRSSLIAASFQFTYFRRVNVDLPSKQLVKQSNDKVRHHYDAPFMALIRLLFTQRSFQDWTRQCY